jgi:hypothetical protein
MKSTLKSNRIGNLFRTFSILTALCGAVSGRAQTQAIVNGAFEDATILPWQFLGSPGANIIQQPFASHSGTHHLSMGNLSLADQGVYQVFTIPTNALQATLSYWWKVESQNIRGADRLFVAVANTSHVVLTNVQVLFSTDINLGYVQKSVDISPYIGQTVEIFFRATTDGLGSLTTFRIDDVAAMYITTNDLPRNDNFVNRAGFTNSLITVRGTSTYASKEPGEPNHAGNPGGRSLWWSWTAPTSGSGTVTINTGGSTFNTLLAVYTGTAVNALTPIASNNDYSADGGSSIWSKVAFPAVPGTTYQIAVDGYNGASGSVVLNLSYQTDTKGPSISFSSPASNAEVTNSFVGLSGKASDPIGVALVEWRLENASGTNDYESTLGTTNWSALAMNLVPGKNTLRVRGYDTGGNVSSVSRSVNYVIVSPFTLSVTGNGSVSPNYNNQLLKVGTSYKLTAKPASGQIFAGWTGDVQSQNPSLTFTMRSNMVVRAEFVPNPFIPVAGSYQGLFYDQAVSYPHSGFVTATVQTTGKFSGKLLMAGQSYSISGQFSAVGKWSNAVPRKGLSPMAVSLELDFNSGTMIMGSVGTDGVSADLMANRTVFTTSNPAPQAGKYTLAIPGEAASTASPAGDGYGTVTVNTAGTVSFSGSLADGTKISQSSAISNQGEWPLYFASKQGSILGWITFATSPDHDLSGSAKWTKLPLSTSKYYPAGFTNSVNVIGSIYRFTNGVPVLNFVNGLVALGGGNLAGGVTNGVSLDSASKITNLSSNALTMSVTTSSGLLKGTMTVPGSQSKVTFNGVVLQKRNRGHGYFLGTNQSGWVYFGP